MSINCRWPGSALRRDGPDADVWSAGPAELLRIKNRVDQIDEVMGIAELLVAGFHGLDSDIEGGVPQFFSMGVDQRARLDQLEADVDRLSKRVMAFDEQS